MMMMMYSSGLYRYHIPISYKYHIVRMSYLYVFTVAGRTGVLCFRRQQCSASVLLRSLTSACIAWRLKFNLICGKIFDFHFDSIVTMIFTCITDCGIVMLLPCFCQEEFRQARRRNEMLSQAT